MRDLVGGTTVRASVDADGGDSEGSSGSWAPVLSGDGGVVAFISDAHDLVPDDGTGWSFRQIFVRDLTSGTTTRPGVDINGGDPNVEMDTGPGISGDGNLVTYYSGASDLVVDDSNGHQDLFVTDLRTSTTSLVSRTSQRSTGQR